MDVEYINNDMKDVSGIFSLPKDEQILNITIKSTQNSHNHLPKSYTISDRDRKAFKDAGAVASAFINVKYNSKNPKSSKWIIAIKKPS